MGVEKSVKYVLAARVNHVRALAGTAAKTLRGIFIIKINSLRPLTSAQGAFT